MITYRHVFPPTSQPPEPSLILPRSLSVFPTHPRHPGVREMLAATVYVALLGCLQAQQLQGHVSIILLGATGDLAKKYLWQGLFQLYLDEAGKGHSFRFHGTALTSTEQGQEVIAKVLESLSCPSDTAPSRCAELKAQFQQLSEYRRLKTPEDYLALSKDIEAQVQHEGLREAGRIFYLSVPPFAYADIARNINSSCRPGPGAWLRVVLEKPFGHDHHSAQQLAAELGSFFQEEEMYRVDHYLGKQVSHSREPARVQGAGCRLAPSAALIMELGPKALCSLGSCGHLDSGPGVRGQRKSRECKGAWPATCSFASPVLSVSQPGSGF